MSDELRFEAVFEAHHRAVLAYALRRVRSEADAEDAVAETFAIAWRRRDRLPDVDAARPWLLAVARRVLANQHRSLARGIRLVMRLGAQPRERLAPTPETPATEALARLRPEDQELLQLLAWDRLSQAEAGMVLGISANAVAIRLHRARRRFVAELENVKGSDGIRTSASVKGRMPGRRRREQPAP
ncbi:MAG: RNA polymerase sigma factor [Chloroflexi bacterium]|nr:RNA polymerase sigma factor [Chloroflexota bacterium]